MNLDHLYNADTRRIVTTAYINIIHLPGSENETSRPAALTKIKEAHSHNHEVGCLGSSIANQCGNNE